MTKTKIIMLVTAFTLSSCGLMQPKRNESRLLSSLASDIESVGNYYCREKGGLKTFELKACKRGKKCDFLFTCYQK